MYHSYVWLEVTCVDYVSYLEYIPSNMHVVLFCFGWLWLYYRLQDIQSTLLVKLWSHKDVNIEIFKTNAHIPDVVSQFLSMNIHSTLYRIKYEIVAIIPISHIPQGITPISHNASLCNRNVHTCTFLLHNGALWDIGPVPCGICKTGLYWLYATAPR